MTIRNALVMFVIILSGAGMAMGQTEWIDHPYNPLFGPGGPGSWDRDGHYMPAVVFDGTTYHMWFAGVQYPTINEIGHATSSDGVEWEMDPSNPVMSTGAAGEWDSVEVWSGPVVYDGTQFHMWYAGWNGSYERVGYATSPDGTSWTKYPDPVMDVGPPGSWDSYVVRPGAVIFDGESFKMWFTGWRSSLTGKVGYAESPDGINWTKRPNPVLEPGGTIGDPWDTPMVFHPEVEFDGSIYSMWYIGGDWYTSYLGYAFSTDGVEWTKHSENPVFQTSSESIESTSVIFDGSAWRMWYADKAGPSYQISHATSDCCSAVVIFADGFEYGDTSAWSTVVP
jgi:predicted GH43/DUF377 family glycosyl hydrolase